MHDVFVSYSSKDKLVADAMVHVLEEMRVRCWIAPRNILAGTDYADAIDGAIKKAKVVVFVCSQSSLESIWCKSEINLAVSNEKIIVPFKIDEASTVGGWNLYLAKAHWIDAVPDPKEKFGEIVRSVTSLLGRDEDSTPVPTGESASVESESVFKERVRKFKTNDGVIDDDEMRRLVSLANRLGIDAARREKLIAIVEDEYDDARSDVAKGERQCKVTNPAESPKEVRPEVSSFSFAERIKSAFAGVGNCQELLLQGAIPDRKMSGARSILAQWTSKEEILVILDTTLFGSASDGMVITPEAVYFKNAFEGPHRILWSEVSDVCAKKDDILISGQEFNGCPVDKKHLREIAEVISGIARELPKASGNDASPGVIIADVCRRICTGNDMYVGGGLREDKLRSAMSSMRVREPAEEVAMQIDSTVFGSAEEGMVLTGKALYFKNFCEEPIRLEWHEVKQVGLDGSDVLFNGEMKYMACGWDLVASRALADALIELTKRLG